MNRWAVLLIVVFLCACQQNVPANQSGSAPPAETAPEPSSDRDKPAESGRGEAVQPPAPAPERAERRTIEAVPAPVPEAAPPAAVPQPRFEPARRLPPSPPKPVPTTPEERTRPSALAGSWYEAEPAKLKEEVEGFVKGAPDSSLKGYPIALIAPHAGYRYSGAMAARAYATLRGRTYSRVFLMGPAHRSVLSGVAFPANTDYFETPLGTIALDVETMDRLKSGPLFRDHPSAHRQEHSLEIHLPFLQTVLPDGFTLVPMVVSGLNRTQIKQVSEALAREIRPGDLVIASSDFTHYGERFRYLGPPDKPLPERGREAALQGLLDEAWKAIAKRDAESFLAHKVATGDTICGFLPIAVLLEMLPAESEATLLGSDMSGRMTGSFDESVSYLSAAFSGLWPYNEVSGAAGLTADEKAALLKLARAQVDAYVKEEKRLSAEDAGVMLTDRLKAQSGSFVTLKIDQQLRGCIGNIMPVKPLYQAVLDNAVNAAHFDRRFKPVTPEELESISVEVSVLTPPQPQARWREIVLGRDGVILQKSGQSAVFLPQVAPEQGWTLEQMLSRLSQKAGMGPDGWREGASFQVFEAIVFGETH